MALRGLLFVRGEPIPEFKAGYLYILVCPWTKKHDPAGVIRDLVSALQESCTSYQRNSTRIPNGSLLPLLIQITCIGISAEPKEEVNKFVKQMSNQVRAIL